MTAIPSPYPDADRFLNIEVFDGVRQSEPPRPLFREPSSPDPFPIDALGPTLGPVAMAIGKITQAADAISANAVLAAASLATQGHADVKIPGLELARPISVFLLTIAASGERKTSADNEAMRGVRNYERERRENYKDEVRRYRNANDAFEENRKAILKKHKDKYDVTSSHLDALGPAPSAPALPIVMVTEPTIEGMVKHMAVGLSTMGIMSSDAGSFIGGHAMTEEVKLRSAARLSSVWDGTPIDSIRAGAEPRVIVGKRVAIHLMAQPEVAFQFYSDPVLRAQGLFSRFLLSAPAPLAGTRVFREADAEALRTLENFGVIIADTLRRTPSFPEGDRRSLVLDDGARAAFIAWHDMVEGKISAGELSVISALAAKLPEHAVRLAAVLTLITDTTAELIPRAAMEFGVHLAGHYAAEALRIAEGSLIDEELRKASRLRFWLAKRGKPDIHLREIYTLGPAEIRDAKSARATARTLEEHGYLLRMEKGTPVDGIPRNEAWRVHGGE